jgi:hypothetical protein
LKLNGHTLGTPMWCCPSVTASTRIAAAPGMQRLGRRPASTRHALTSAHAWEDLTLPGNCAAAQVRRAASGVAGSGAPARAGH